MSVIGEKRGNRWRGVLLATLMLLICAAVGLQLVQRTPAGRAAFNVAEYRLRRLWSGWLGERQAD